MSTTLQTMGQATGEIYRNLLSFLRISRRQEPPNVQLSGQIFIVTGGNRGLGKGVTLELAARSAQVIIAARGSEAAGAVIQEASSLYPEAPAVTYYPLDVASFESIRDFSREIHEKFGESKALSGLVNNAGILTKKQNWTTACPDQEEMELAWAVNVFGLAYLTNQLQDLLLRSKNGARMVNVSSLGHVSVAKVDTADPMSRNKSFKWLRNYAESKLAVMFYTKQLAKQLYPRGIHVYGVDPGICQTELASNIGTFGRFSMESVLGRPFMRTPTGGSRSIMFPLVLPKETYDPNNWYFWYVP